MDTSILYQECNLKVNRAFHEYHEACRDGAIRMAEIDLAFMESTIDEYQKEVLYEDAENNEKKQGIIATIFNAIIDLIKAVMDAIAGIFRDDNTEDKCKDIEKLGSQIKVDVNSPDYKKQQKALEKYMKRMEEIIKSGKDADWIDREQKKAEEQYHKDLKSNFNLKAALIPLGVLGAAAGGLMAYLKISGKTLTGAVEDASSKIKAKGMVKARTKGMSEQEALRVVKEMEQDQERRVRAIQNANAAATRNLERTTKALTSSINRTVVDIMMDKHRIAETTKTGKPLDWFKNKWAHISLRAHNAKLDRQTGKYDRKVRSFNANPDVISMRKEEAKNQRMLDSIRDIHDKKFEKATGMHVMREPLTIDYIRNKFRK